MKKIEITCYVNNDNELVAIDTNEVLRIATTTEKRNSRDEDGSAGSNHTGAIRVSVSVTTLKKKAPKLVAEMIGAYQLIS